MNINLKLNIMRKLYFLFMIFATAFTANAQVVISQVYGGGGNAGTTYKSDFVELFNRGSTPEDLTDYVLQYATAAGNFGTHKAYLPNDIIQPGAYYLVQLATGANGTVDLDADFIPTGTQAFNMSATDFKIALTSNDVTVTSPTDSNVIDFVGVGSANMYEGTAAMPALTKDKAAFRNGDGCEDTDDNSEDFTTGVPSPRNSQTPVNICATSLTKNDIEGLNVFPNPVDDILFITSKNNLEKNIKLFDMTGKKVIDSKMNSEINISSLKAGIYVAKITEMGKTATRKIIVK